MEFCSFHSVPGSQLLCILLSSLCRLGIQSSYIQVVDSRIFYRVRSGGLALITGQAGAISASLVAVPVQSDSEKGCRPHPVRYSLKVFVEKHCQ